MGQPANPDQVDAEFDQIISFLTNNTVHRDGSKAMTGALTLPSNPSLNLHAATKQYVDAMVSAPALPGVVVEFGGTVAPGGWLLCDGSAVSRTTYSALFNAIGTTHGAGNGSSTFNLPDCRGRVGVGAGNGIGLTARPAGQKHGHEQMHEHDHPQRVSANPGTGPLNGRLDYVADASGFSDYPQGIWTGKAGSGDGANMPPFIVLLKIIKT